MAMLEQRFMQHHRSFGISPAKLGTRLLDLLSVWQRRAEDRRYLRRMDERTLKDIGASRGDVAREATKPFWRG